MLDTRAFSVERFVDQSARGSAACHVAQRRVSDLPGVACAHDCIVSARGGPRSTDHRTGRSAQARRPGVYQTRAHMATGPNQVVVLGHHQAQGPDPVPLLLGEAMDDPSSGRGRSCCGRGWSPAHENAHLAERLSSGDLPETGHRPAATHDPLPTAACPLRRSSSSRCSSRT